MSAVITAHDTTTTNAIGEPFIAAYPKNYVPGTTRGLILCHAAQETEAPWLAQGNLGGKYAQLFYQLAARYPVISTFMSYSSGPQVGDAWGNDSAVAFIDAARNYLINTIGALNGPVLMLGTSMGGLSVWSYMRAHPTNVQTAVLVCPVTDLTDSMILASFNASINAAYGGSYVDDTYGDLHSPIRFCSLFRDTPIQMWIADDDTVANPAKATITLSALRQTDLHHMTGGHNNLNDLDIPTVLAWLAAHA